MIPSEARVVCVRVCIQYTSYQVEMSLPKGTSDMDRRTSLLRAFCNVGFGGSDARLLP